MLPHVTKLNSLHSFMDGGSLGAYFDGDDGNKYTLFFEIEWPEFAAEQRRFISAFLKKAVPTEYTSPVTGEVFRGWRKEESTTISWQEARSLLESLKPHLEGFVSEYEWVFGAMVEAAARDGK